MEILLLSMTGLLAGVLAGLLGIGGGLVIVPALAALFIHQGASIEVAMPMAVATSLGSMLMTSASAIWFHDRRGAVAWPCVLRLAPAVALGALAGAWLAGLLGGRWLAIFFAIVIALIGVRMLLVRTTAVSGRAPFPRLWWIAGPGIGAISAMIGIGGGSFNVPYLARNGYPMVQAVAIASACGWPIALAGSIGFVVSGWTLNTWPMSLGWWYLPGLIIVGIGGAAGAPLGVRIAHHLPAGKLRRLFGACLLLIALMMLR